MHIKGLCPLRICALTLLAFMACAAPAAAQPMPASCDAGVWGAISARSWLEGKREMEVAQTIILKADSVLEYSCFNTRMNELESFANGTFSRGIGPSLDSIVNDVMSNYLDQNFGHPLAGGRGVPGIPGACETIGVVSDFMRCDNIDKSKFLTLEELVNHDPRQLPYPCAGGGYRDIWAAGMAAAFPVPSTPAAMGGMDDTITYLNMLSPGSCGTDPADLNAIPTGLQVRMGSDIYPDAVCSAPSCWYDPGSGKCRP
jgi:hypothetical protein